MKLIIAIFKAEKLDEVGGHSLLSMRVVHAIEQQTGYRLNPRVMFFQSLRQIASSLPASAHAIGDADASR